MKPSKKCAPLGWWPCHRDARWIVSVELVVGHDAPFGDERTVVEHVPCCGVHAKAFSFHGYSNRRRIGAAVSEEEGREG